MRIRVNNHYVGVDSGNQMIYPGIYEKGDALLHGLESDLIKIGYAEWIDPTDVPNSDDDLTLKTVEQLQAIAKKKGVDVSNAKKKNDYIKLLTDASAPTPEPKKDGEDGNAT